MVLLGIGVTDVGILILSLFIYQGSSDSGSGNLFILSRETIISGLYLTIKVLVSAESYQKFPFMVVPELPKFPN